MRAATKVYSLSSGKGKGEWHMGQLSLSGMGAPYWHLVRTSAMCVFIHASARAIESKRRERTQPRVDARDAAPCGRA
jgi:hypothetical protein